MKTFSKASRLPVLCIAGLVMSSCVIAQENIALHRPVTLTPKAVASPGNNNDAAQLTDGVYASTSSTWSTENQKLPLWQQPGALYWRVKGKAIINIDLGSVQPISGVIFSTAGNGKSKEGWSITWPQSIYVSTSNDNKTWHYVGDLTELSSPPSAEKDTTFRYIARNLKTHGRYVSLGVVGYPYIIADEVEVLRGDNALLKLPAGEPTQSMEEFVLRNQITDKAQTRQNEDIKTIREFLKTAPISPAKKKTFDAQLIEYATLTEKMPLQPADFKTKIPISNIHRDILSVHGAALAEQEFKPLTIWKKHRYAWNDLINIPERQSSVTMDITAFKNEFRSDSILLTNASNKPMKITVRAPETLLGGLQLSHGVWSDTLHNTPVQSALIPLQQSGDIYSFEIPAGITGRLWVTIDGSKIPSGNHKSTFVISGGGEKLNVPINVDIANLIMQRPRLSLVMWDGTGASNMIINMPQIEGAANEMMRTRFMDTPETSHSRIMSGTPKESDYDADNQLKPDAKIDFQKFDEWLKKWPTARYYLIYHPVEANYVFAGAEMGTPEFNARYGNYIKAIADRAKTLGVDPAQLLFCFKDETHNDESDQIVIKMTSAVKSVKAGVTVFSNPQWADPTQAKDPRAFILPDILCISARPGTMDFYEKIRREHGTKLWFYTTPPGVKMKDPQAFYRDYAWTTFGMNGSGMGWWGFADERAPTSWNAYNTAYGGYAPAFIDEKNVYSSVHWEAVREGVEDFELFGMLSDAVEKSTDTMFKQKGRELLSEIITLGNKIYSKGKWSEQTQPEQMDDQIVKVRTMLIEKETIESK